MGVLCTAPELQLRLGLGIVNSVLENELFTTMLVSFQGSSADFKLSEKLLLRTLCVTRTIAEKRKNTISSVPLKTEDYRSLPETQTFFFHVSKNL